MNDHLTTAEVRAIHDDQIAWYGGADGLRDAGLLDAALHRPRSGYYEDLIAEAAALWESLAQNHPFVDGNKRTAFGSMYAFLLINGVELAAAPEEAERFVLGIHETDGVTFERLEAWLREHARAAPGAG